MFVCCIAVFVLKSQRSTCIHVHRSAILVSLNVSAVHDHQQQYKPNNCPPPGSLNPREINKNLKALTLSWMLPTRVPRKYNPGMGPLENNSQCTTYI